MVFIVRIEDQIKKKDAKVDFISIFVEWNSGPGLFGGTVTE